jgi:hypothetical protein
MESLECPSLDIAMCKCTQDPSRMIHGTDATLYPKAGCFRVGRSLYNTRLFYNSFGRHFWDLFIGNPAGICRRTVYLYSKHSIYYAALAIVQDGGVNRRVAVCFPIDPTIGGVMPVVSVWRIQRAVRGFLRHKFNQRALAVMMGLHSRLGCQCSLSCLPADVVSKNILCAK